MPGLKDLSAPQGVMVDKEGIPLPPWYRWITFTGNVLFAITSSGTTAERPVKLLWLGRNFWNTDIGQMEWYDGSTWVTWGGGGGGAPTNATYVTMTTDATLTNERTLAVGSPVTLTDGGAGNPVTIDFDQTVTLGNNARVAVSKNSGATVGTRRRLNLIEGTNVTLTIADDPGNEEVDVTIAASGGGGGGSVTSGSATVDFGFPSGLEGDIASTSVALPSVLSTSEITVSPRYISTLTDHDAEDYAIEGITATVGVVTAGVGFDIHAYAPRGTWGQYNVDYLVNV